MPTHFYGRIRLVNARGCSAVPSNCPATLFLWRSRTGAHFLSIRDTSEPPPTHNTFSRTSMRAISTDRSERRVISQPTDGRYLAPPASPIKVDYTVTLDVSTNGKLEVEKESGFQESTASTTLLVTTGRRSMSQLCRLPQARCNFSIEQPQRPSSAPKADRVWFTSSASRPSSPRRSSRPTWRLRRALSEQPRSFRSPVSTPRCQTSRSSIYPTGLRRSHEEVRSRQAVEDRFESCEEL